MLYDAQWFLRTHGDAQPALGCTHRVRAGLQQDYRTATIQAAPKVTVFWDVLLIARRRERTPHLTNLSNLALPALGAARAISHVLLHSVHRAIAIGAVFHDIHVAFTWNLPTDGSDVGSAVRIRCRRESI